MLRFLLASLVASPSTGRWPLLERLVATDPTTSQVKANLRESTGYAVVTSNHDMHFIWGCNTPSPPHLVWGCQPKKASPLFDWLLLLDGELIPVMKRTGSFQPIWKVAISYLRLNARENGSLKQSWTIMRLKMTWYYPPNNIMLIWLIVKLIIPYHHFYSPPLFNDLAAKRLGPFIPWEDFLQPRYQPPTLAAKQVAPIPIYGCRWKYQTISSCMLTLGALGSWNYWGKPTSTSILQWNTPMLFAKFKKHHDHEIWSNICTNTNLNR